MKLCAIEPKELEEKILIRFAENQNDELLEDLSDYVINSQKEIERLNNIINKAIEYVEESYNETVEGIEGVAKFFSKRNETLLKILKGSDKE